MILTMQVHK